MPAPGTRRLVVWMHAPAVPQWSLPARSRSRIRDALGEGWELVTVDVPLEATGDGVRTSPPALLEAIATAEVYVGFGIPRDAFLGAPRLRWIHSGAAGVSGSLFPELVESDVVLTNSGGIHAEPMAEHALACILHFARGLDIAVRAQAGREWAHEALTGPESPLLAPGEISGRTLLIIGYGGIGRALGTRAAALGMRVRAIRRTRGALPPELDGLGTSEDLEDFLPQADYLALAVPETPETRDLVGPAELALLPEEAVVINLARGAVLDEDALRAALLERRLRGAALDVFRREPLPGDDPLWRLDNVLITPHVGGTSGRFWDRETDLIVRNVHRYLAGDELLNRVDKERGY